MRQTMIEFIAALSIAWIGAQVLAGCTVDPAVVHEIIKSGMVK